MNSRFKNFRLLAIAEGISFLLLLFVAMPLKYYAGVTQIVPLIGMLHGFLFMAFMMLSLDISHKLNWSTPFWLLVFISSMIPGGTFLMDMKLKQIKVQD
ncbi:MAG: DUF3817 domain-containing protein [Gammaproteobacteria bacterium]|nr:DUF3817 domain-containing protein [Gammaproteobacteria bacterium]